MRSTLAALLILALAACGDSGPSRLDIDDVRIAKVSGDQAAVAGTSQATPLHSVSASPRFAVTAGEWTPEPLVGRIETVGARTSGISGPSMLPPDMLAHWHLDPEAGTLLASSTPPDDSLHIVNRWAPSTRAGEYTAVARRILADGSVHEDARWTLVVEPGEPTSIHLEVLRLCIGDTIDLRDHVTGGRDAHGNDVDADVVAALPDSVIAWTWSDRVSSSSASGPSGAGWTLTVPDFGDHGYRYLGVEDGWGYDYAARLHIGIGAPPSWGVEATAHTAERDHCSAS